jgi:hypothetical protein
MAEAETMMAKQMKALRINFKFKKFKFEKLL